VCEVCDAFEQRGVAPGAHLGVTELAGVTRLDLAAQLLGHGLHAVADAQHRQAQLVHGIGCLVVHLVDAGVAARKDHTLEQAIGLAKSRTQSSADVAGMHLAVHMGLAHAAGNELGDLGAEIEDEDFLVLHGAVDQVKKEKGRLAAGMGLDGGKKASVCPVVGRFLGDLHVVHVAFADTGRGDLDELRLVRACLRSWRSRSSPCWRARRRPSGK
jgi:hypothetical protein